MALRAATPSTVVPPAATASRSAAATSNTARGASPSPRAASTAAGRPNRTASRGVVAGEAIACLVAACVGFGFAFRAGTGRGFALGFGAAGVVRDGVVDVETGRGVGAGLDGRVAAGAGVAVLTTARGFVGTGAADEPTTGASGVGTARAGFEDWVDFEDLVAVEDAVANPPGGSSGAGIGVPPAAHAAAGQANAARQAHTASKSRLSRRDDVHLDTYVPPFGASRYVGRRTRVNTGEGGRRTRRPPCLACT